MLKLKRRSDKKSIGKISNKLFYLVTGRGNFEASTLYEFLLEIMTNKIIGNSPNISVVVSHQLFKSDTCFELIMF
jgi:hypothetical protein